MGIRPEHLHDAMTPNQAARRVQELLLNAEAAWKARGSRGRTLAYLGYHIQLAGHHHHPNDDCVAALRLYKCVAPWPLRPSPTRRRGHSALVLPPPSPSEHWKEGIEREERANNRHAAAATASSLGAPRNRDTVRVTTCACCLATPHLILSTAARAAASAWSSRRRWRRRRRTTWSSWRTAWNAERRG
uniref:Exonuclease domain-containing protein n=1 Tax=Oryza meridionalis TaxID=40149 RepID=A0A0E0FEV3_9ORYZ